MHILFVHNRLPDAQRSGSDFRLMQVLSALLALDHQVTFLALWPTETPQAVAELVGMGIRVYQGDAEQLRFFGKDRIPTWRFSQVLASGCFEIAILSLWFWQQFSMPELYLEHIRELSPATRVIVLSDDRHGEREMGLAQLSTSLLDAEYARDVALREQEAYALADQILTITDEDRTAIFALTSGHVPVEMIPFSAPVSPAFVPPFHSRSGLLFFGNFTNPAVTDAGHHLLETLLPRIRESLPGVTLTLAGYGSNQLPGANTPGIIGKGFVDDLTPLLEQNRLFLAPLRAGTGIATKNVVALAHGLPVITSSVGAQGLPHHPDLGMVVADTAEDFVCAVSSAYTDSVLWDRLSVSGRAALEIGNSDSQLRVSLHASIKRPILARDFSKSTPLFSNRALDVRIPGLQFHLPSHARRTQRVRAYFFLGQELASSGLMELSLAQLRHALTTIRFGPEASAWLPPILRLMAICYSALGNRDSAERCKAAQIPSN